MNIGFYSKMPLQPLVLLWLSYIWLGCNISYHHIIWLMGAFVAALVFAVVWMSISWLERLVSIGSRTLIVVLFLSASIALLGTWSLLLNFIVIPLAATVLAGMELGFAGFSQHDKLLVLSVLAAFGLVVGELISFLL